MFCECGCGQEVVVTRWTPAKRFVKGHNGRRPVEERFWEKVNKTLTCWLWTGAVVPKGYGVFNRGSNRAYLAHRFAWELLNGPLVPGQPVLHSCDVPGCVRPDHLRIGTRHENNTEMATKGRAHHGEKHHLAKLSVDEVMSIRRLHTAGELTQRQLARAFNVDPSTISSIVRYKHRRLG